MVQHSALLSHVHMLLQDAGVRGRGPKGFRGSDTGRATAKLARYEVSNAACKGLGGMHAAGGLVATASVNILFGASTAYPLLLAFWGLNGLLQARRCSPAQ